MHKNDDISLLGIIVLIIIIIILEPLAIFWLSYFCGWIAKLTIGNVLCKSLTLIGLNLLPDQIPMLAGCLGWVGSFFHSSVNFGNKTKK